jgi:hypothetical protein
MRTGLPAPATDPALTTRSRHRDQRRLPDAVGGSIFSASCIVDRERSLNNNMND